MNTSASTNISSDIHVTTLGRLSVERGGEVVENFISTKAVLLFVYLAMHPGEHSRKKLASMLWSETSDEQALKNLRTVLSSVRQQLGDALIVEYDMLAVNPAMSISVDATRFENGCLQVFSAAGTLDLLKSMQDLAQLYQGDFLRGVAIRDAEELDTWISDKQRHLQHLYTRLLFELVDVAHKQSHDEIGLDYAWKLVSIDPLWDAAQRQLMRLLFHANRANEALQQYERFARLLQDELDAEPDDETAALYEQIRDRSMPARTRQASLGLSDMPFVEPVEDIEIAQRMLNAPQCKLLTIFGISGIGKTALVTQLAFHRQHMYHDGAYLISMKRAQSARDVPFLLATTLGIEIDLNNQIDAANCERMVLDHLKTRHLLLVLDNYEDVLPETDLLQRILTEGSQVQVIVASQAPLNLFREWLLPLKGLRVPPTDDANPEAYEAVRLFELTAQRTNPRFNLQANIDGVSQICRLVDGLPLAIVIAAGWTQILPINKIIENISEGQEFTLPFQQTLPPHHQSLEMMLEYTWNTLNAAEQQALTALSIFNVVFDLDDVQEICGVDVPILTTLIQRSLVQKFDDRYRMHQLVWRYARKRLLYSEQREALGERYLAYFTQVLSQIQQQRLPLHEYLLAIETRYVSIWNHDWMPKDFQPVYILSMSRFLMLYWETSRADAVPTILKLLESVTINELAPEMRVLLHIQLARLLLHGDDLARANRHLAAALSADTADTRWADLGALYCVCALMLLKQMTSGFEPDIVSPEADAMIILHSGLKLASLFLDMDDTLSADDVFAHLGETNSSDQPGAPAGDAIDALIIAMRGTVAAVREDAAGAFAHFSAALKILQGLDEPALTHSLTTALMRVQHQ